MEFSKYPSTHRTKVKFQMEPGAFAKRFRCQCCNNPWNVTEGESDKSPFVACLPCRDDSKGFSGLDPSNLDDSVSPKHNFFLWSNGGWKKNNPIPPEYPSWNTFMSLRDLNLERIKTLLDELQAGNINGDEEHRKLADMYNSFMDEEEINKLGLEPLKDVFSLITDTKTDVATVIGMLHSRFGVYALFRLYSTSDKKNSDRSIAAITQGGLGLPDRDYYFDADKEEKRTKYIEYIKSMLLLLGSHGFSDYQCEENCAKIAESIFNFEKKLANAHLTRSEARDPEKTYNKMSIATLQGKTCEMTWGSYLAFGINNPNAFQWRNYFDAIGKGPEALGDINVATVDAIIKMCALAQDPCSRVVLKHYLHFHVVHNLAQHLPNQFVDLHFDFNDKELKGTAQQRPRWKRALQCLEEALGDSLGKLYISKYFPEKYKTQALSIVEKVREALEERLNEVEWMFSATKSEALKKMQRFRVKIGFPDKWEDYSDVIVMRGNHLNNVFSGHRHDFLLDLSRMNAPTDRDRWFMTPQTVNAYYHPSLNEIVFPAAILQPPFFDPEADDAVQFGSMGAVIGHEMTHGFDDQGRKYDFEGNMRDWWTQSDGLEYEKRAGVMIEQAERFEVYGVKLKGKLTCGENIADLGGLKLALKALKKHLKQNGIDESMLINGFTPIQRFFLAWSQAWRENVTKERALQLVTLDPHGPNELRCNGTVSNIDEFYEAFDIQEGDNMYKPASERVNIW